MVLSILVFGALELASLGTVLAIANTLPQTPAVSLADKAEPSTQCVPQWMMPSHMRCPAR